MKGSSRILVHFTILVGTMVVPIIFVSPQFFKIVYVDFTCIVPILLLMAHIIKIKILQCFRQMNLFGMINKLAGFCETSNPTESYSSVLSTNG